MLFRSLRSFLVFLAFAVPLAAHAPPTYLPVPPLRVRANTLVDAAGKTFLLRGVRMPEADAITPLTFRVIQQRWNMNAVRLPVSADIWRREGAAYFDRVGEVVRTATGERLVVVLAASGTGLPGPDMAGFWSACAARFKDVPGVIFSLFDQPSAVGIPGYASGVRRAAEWRVWLESMQPLVDAIRAGGAQQIVSAPSFDDALEFQGFGPEFYIHDPNVLYEVHPFYDHGITEAQRNANFGFLAGAFPVYAGAWGMPFGQPGAACAAIPPGPAGASELLLQTFVYFDSKGISWTAADFGLGSLIQDFDEYTATALDRDWTCDASSDPGVGIGVYVLLWMTGDPAGFGSILPEQIASASGGAALPVAPGQIIAIYGQLVGPEEPSYLTLDESGSVATTLADTQVLFDGIAAPVVLASYFQVNVQAPYELAGREVTTVRLLYRGVPSNRIQLALIDAAPGIFPALALPNEAAAHNQDGSSNSSSRPAERGSIVVLVATGFGQTAPPSETGRLAQVPLAAPGQPVSLTIGGRRAEVLFAGAAPGYLGVTQINARVPADLPPSTTPVRAPVVVTVGSHTSRPELTLWVR